MKSKVKILYIIASAILLSGCAGMNSDFGCNQVQGLSSCTSMWTVNHMANQGAFNNTTRVLTDPNGQVITTSTQQAAQTVSTNTSSAAVSSSSNSSTAPNGGTMGYMAPTPQPGKPIRASESVQQIWIAPWVDTSGNFHDSDYIYHVINPGHWIGAPVQAVQSSY